MWSRVFFAHQQVSVRNWQVVLLAQGQRVGGFKVSKPEDLAKELTLEDLQFCDEITLTPVRLPRD